MGGLGSGGCNRRRRGTVEGSRRLTASLMDRSGVFRDGWGGRWSWTSEDGRTNRIVVTGGSRSIALSFRFRVHGGPWREVAQVIAIDRVSKPYGGAQSYFMCPRCSRRATYLYGAQAEFLCRTCSGLTHASSGEGAADRAMRRSNAIRQRLGGEPGLDALIPRRPKRMRHATFDRLVERIEAAETEVLDAHIRILSRLAKPRGIVVRRGQPGRRRKAFWS